MKKVLTFFQNFREVIFLKILNQVLSALFLAPARIAWQKMGKIWLKIFQIVSRKIRKLTDQFQISNINIESRVNFTRSYHAPFVHSQLDKY